MHAQDPDVDLEPMVTRVRKWLAEGKDVRVVAKRRAVDGFPMIEIWGDGGVEVLTRAGAIRENRVAVAEPSPQPVPGATSGRTQPARRLAVACSCRSAWRRLQKETSPDVTPEA